MPESSLPPDVTPPAPEDKQLGQLLAEVLRMLVLQARAGELAKAEDGMQMILKQAQSAGLSALTAETLYRLSHIHDLRGDYYTASDELAAALEITERNGLHSLAAACHFARGRQLMLRGRLAEAVDALGVSLSSATRGGSVGQQGDVYVLLGECCLRLGQLGDAHSYVTEAIKLLRSTGGSGLLPTLVAGAAIARQLRHDEQAAALLREADALSDTAGYSRVMSVARAVMALDCFALGAPEEGGRLLAHAEELCGTHHPDIQLHLARGKQLDHLGRFGPAAEEYLAAQRLAQKRQSRFELATTRLERVAGAIANGKLGYAHAILLDAELAFESFGAQLSLGRTYCGWVRYWIASGNQLAASAVLKQAQAIAARVAPELGLQFAADLAWAEQAVAAGQHSTEKDKSDTPPPLLHPASTLN